MPGQYRQKFQPLVLAHDILPHPLLTTTTSYSKLMDSFVVHTSALITIESTYIPDFQSSLSSQRTATLRINVTPYETEVMINERA